MLLVPIVAPYTWELWSLNVPPLMIGLIGFESIVTSKIKILGEEGKELLKVALWHRLTSLVGFQGCASTWRAVSPFIPSTIVQCYEVRVTQHVDVTSGSHIQRDSYNT
jgi:hypothetical protein